MSDTEQEKSKLDKAMATALSVLGDGTVYNTISESLNAKPDTVTISRECAERSHVRASYYLQAAYNKAVGPEALKDFNELTKALEVET